MADTFTERIRDAEKNDPGATERVQSVTKATGIPAHKLRPDLYPAPEKVG